ncbi:metabolite traffic protein EboE [Cellulosimicrobium marinum]|uniref:metabolite traffic protein EboE n=1 Tax=Cellulosimicrobium marinum TaxID=1638992 RepID=UPI001E368AA2|nr:metabolite traffic protein EboE [Cellulosimicrobium marinum]MCB7136315.1 metabolite traffic protein EboE [Cellulosimicrobium marinum]
MHLSYCTNVHPAEDMDGVLDQLARYAAPVREAAGLDVLGVGLWMPAVLAHRLAGSPADRDRLRTALAEHGLEVRTLNAFPYGGFHADVVKLDVYTPTWADPERLAYTLECAEVLADLLPDGADGSISTLPLAWREPWTDADDAAATRAFAELSAGLRDLRDRTGKTVRVAVEPEPGCVLDTVEDVVAWLAARTGPAGADRTAGGTIDPDHVGVCLDTCHLAVSFADPAGAVARITDAGLRVVKVQASAALHVADPSDPAARDAVAGFVEQRYIHQVRELAPDGAVLPADDLPDALGDGPAPGAGDGVGHDAAGGLPGAGPWRVHFHVPLHHEPRPPLAATSDVLRTAVEAVRATPHGDAAHLDVETYTWSVLPEGAATDSLVAGIAAELRWASDHLLPAEHEVDAAIPPNTTEGPSSTASNPVLGADAPDAPDATRRSA